MKTYIGTITFKSEYDYKRKCKLIDTFYSRLAPYLDYKKSKEHFLEYSIEYHKVENQDDPEAPHIHFILYTPYLPNYRYNAILSMFRDYYGRAQLINATTLKLRQWEKYLLKDVEQNEKLYNFKHYFKYHLTKDLLENLQQQQVFDDDIEM